MAFNRVVEITAGPEGQPGVTVSELFMTFSIEKKSTRSPNTANVEIYNPAPNTIASFTKAKNKLIIRAGYEDEGGALACFTGSITSAKSKRDGPDRVIEIEAMDGVQNLMSKNIVLSYSENTPATQIYSDIVSEIGYPVIGKSPVLSGVYTGGFSFIGKAKDALSQVLSRFNYNWTVQNETLLVYTGEAPEQTIGLWLSYETGLLHIDRKDQDISIQPKPRTGTVPKPGTYYEIETLFFPQISPGAKVNIDTPEIEGLMKVVSCKQSGDNRDGDFKVEAEMVVVEV